MLPQSASSRCGIRAVPRPTLAETRPRKPRLACAFVLQNDTMAYSGRQRAVMGGESAPTGEGEMSARETKISRRLLLAGGSAFGLGVLSAPASSQAPEKITYLFPAPPILPAFGPIRLAQGQRFFTPPPPQLRFTSRL